MKQLVTNSGPAKRFVVKDDNGKLSPVFSIRARTSSLRWLGMIVAGALVALALSVTRRTTFFTPPGGAPASVT